jgi:hypothetical protein
VVSTGSETQVMTRVNPLRTGQIATQRIVDRPCSTPELVGESGCQL